MLTIFLGELAQLQEAVVFPELVEQGRLHLHQTLQDLSHWQIHNQSDLRQECQSCAYPQYDPETSDSLQDR